MPRMRSVVARLVARFEVRDLTRCLAALVLAQRLERAARLAVVVAGLEHF